MHLDIIRDLRAEVCRESGVYFLRLRGEVKREVLPKDTLRNRENSTAVSDRCVSISNDFSGAARLLAGRIIRSLFPCPRREINSAHFVNIL